VFQLQKLPPTTGCELDVKITSIVSVGEELEAIALLQTPQTNDGRHLHLELVALSFTIPDPCGRLSVVFCCFSGVVLHSTHCQCLFASKCLQET